MRFTITYRISLFHNEDINSKIESICREQSVELPRSVLSHHIEREIVGTLQRLERNSDATYFAHIAYPIGNIGMEITQFLNVLFGNISLMPGIQVHDLQWDQLPEGLLPGPRFGIEGVRSKLGITNRALSCTALKPLGSTSIELAEMASEFALGGIDLIKDDHGIANQSYAPFEERLKRITDAVHKANDATGTPSWYIPHITAHGDELLKRFEMARDLGAGAVMICPQLCSPDALSMLSRQENPLPIIVHPAFSGVYVLDKHHGFDKAFLYGALWRAMGADMTIFPNHAGRFSFTLKECVEIVKKARNTALPYNTTFPVPGGGMQRNSIPYWIEKYGRDTIFLIGGSLYQHPKGIRIAASEIKNLLEEATYED
jgi:ribulose-bisphosphate carboxylase large chain